MKTKIPGLAILAIASIFVSTSLFAQDALILSDETTATPYDVLRKSVLSGPSPITLTLRAQPTRPTGAMTSYGVTSPTKMALSSPMQDPFAIRKAVDTARNDLIARLRVPITNIKVLSALPGRAGEYMVVLGRDLPMTMLETTAGQITPQPYGKYTYIIKPTGYRVGSTEYIVDSVGYFDGSYDRYDYQPVESYWGTILKIADITQYDGTGQLKAVVSYLINGYPDDRIQHVTHYEILNGAATVKYVDEYQYYIEEMMPGQQVATSVIRVNRFEGEVRIPESEPLCVFLYRGQRGQERLESCAFADGTRITYSNDLAQAVYSPSSSVPIMTFRYLDGNGQPTVFNIATTVVYYSDGRLPVAYPGLVDPVGIVIEYRNGELIRKAGEKIKEHETNIASVNDTQAQEIALAKEFAKLNTAYESLLARLPEGSPFTHLVFALPTLAIPVQQAIYRSNAEISILKAAIDTNDYGTISAHLGLSIPEVDAALRGLGLFIGLYTKYSGQLGDAISAINVYVEMWNKVKETAVKDLAARLRVAEGEIKVLKVNGSDNIYTVTLERPMGDIRPLAAGVQGQVTPQPYGTYTYTIRAMGYNNPPIGMVPSLLYIVEKVEYFDGSYDLYKYRQNPAETGPEYLGIERIEQYDRDGNHKATVSYLDKEGRPKDRIQAITHYETMADGTQRIKYVDEYRYLATTSVGPNGQVTIWAISVKRYEGEVRIPEAEPICVFTYRGDVEGQERLVRCDFNDGTYITYINDLANEVRDKDGKLLMSFRHHYDNDLGGITETKVTYPDGSEKIYQGLADPVDIVVQFTGGRDSAVRYLKDNFNPDSYTLDSWTMVNGAPSFIFKFADGSGIRIIVNPATGVPSSSKNDGAILAVLEARKAIAANMGADMSLVHVNGMPSVISEKILPSIPGQGNRVSTYTVTAQLNNITITMECVVNEVYRDMPSYGVEYRVETMTLRSLINNTTRTDLLLNANNYVRDVLGQGGSPLQGWSVAGGEIAFAYGLADGTSTTVYVNVATGRAWDPKNEALRLAREDFAMRNGLDPNDPSIIVEYWGNSDGVEWVHAFLPDWSVEITFGYAVVAGKVVMPSSYGSGIDPAGNTVYIETQSSFDQQGVLTAQEAYINIVNPVGAPAGSLFVQYDVGAEGTIMATRVYDQAGNELPELGGEGFIDPKNIAALFMGVPGDADLVLKTQARDRLAKDLTVDPSSIRVVMVEDMPHQGGAPAPGVMHRLVSLEYNGEMYYVTASRAITYPPVGWTDISQVSPQDNLMGALQSREFLAGSIGTDLGSIQIINFYDTTHPNIVGIRTMVTELQYGGSTYFIQSGIGVFPGAQWSGFVYATPLGVKRIEYDKNAPITIQPVLQLDADGNLVKSTATVPAIETPVAPTSAPAAQAVINVDLAGTMGVTETVATNVSEVPAGVTTTGQPAEKQKQIIKQRD